MYFKRIEMNGAQVKLDWIDEFGAHHVLECIDAPRPELRSTLQSLVPAAIELCELRDAISKDNDVLILGVKFSWKDDIPSVVIEAVRKLSNHAGWEFTTNPIPYKAWESIVMPNASNLATCMQALEGEATLYIRGRRAQTDMFAEDAPKNVNAKTGEIMDKETAETEIEIRTPGRKTVKTTLGGLKKVADGLKDGTIKPPTQTKNQRRQQAARDRLHQRQQAH